jgi:hypothetical protein
MKERKLANGRRGGGGAKSYDGEKAKFSINYTILSATVILTLGTTVYKWAHMLAGHISQEQI